MQLIHIGPEALLKTGRFFTEKFTEPLCEKGESYEDILSLLQGAGITVDGIEIKEKEIDRLRFPSDMPDE